MFFFTQCRVNETSLIDAMERYFHVKDCYPSVRRSGLSYMCNLKMQFGVIVHVSFQNAVRGYRICHFKIPSARMHGERNLQALRNLYTL